MKFKKILKILSSLLFVPILSGCALFSGNNNDDGKEQLVITKASFDYTYSTITFNFRKDTNAIYYTAYFDGEQKASLTKIEPATEYRIPNLEDGTYKVFLKAYANMNYADSDLFLMGELQKEKSKYSNESIEISASITASYAIEVNVENTKKNDSTPFTTRIYKDNALFKEEKNITSKKTFSTEEELSAGEYTVSAFFQETGNFLASDEKFIDQPLNIEKRKIEVKSFNAVYSEGSISLYWQSQNSIPSTKKLKIIQNGSETEFTDSMNGMQIKSGMSFSADNFSLGEISFQLTIVPMSQDTYLQSDTLTAKTTISNFKESAPNISVEYTEGDIKIIKNDNRTGLYSVKIESSGEMATTEYHQHSFQMPLFSYEETVSASSFPLIFEKANEEWKHAYYTFSVQKLSASTFGENSDAIVEEILVKDVEPIPNVKTTKINLQNEPGFEMIFEAQTPFWESAISSSYLYQIDVTGCGDAVYSEDLTSRNNIKRLTFPFEKMAASEYTINVTSFLEDAPYGYMSYSVLGIESFNGLKGGEIDEHLIENLTAGDTISTTQRGYGDISPLIRVSLDKNFAYTDISGVLYYTRATEGAEGKIEFTFEEDPWKTGTLEKELRMIDFKSRSNGGCIQIIVKAWLGDYYTELEWYLGPFKPPVS